MSLSKTLLLLLLPWMLIPSATAETITLKVSHLEPTDRQLAHYYLSSLFSWDSQALHESDEAFLLDCDKVPAPLCRNLAPMIGRSGRLYLDQLETYWGKAYHETVEERGDAGLIPDNLAAFRQITNYLAWPKTVIAASRVKLAKRVIYRGITQDGRKISVSETHQDGRVREVEIAVASRLTPRNYHFYVYGPGQTLARESSFPSGMHDAPQVCVSCHVNQVNGYVDQFMQ